MTRVADVMTRGIRMMSPQDSAQLAAQAMAELDVGAIPVCEDRRLVGMVTDRDLALRCVAQGLAPQHTRLSGIVSPDVKTCRDDQAVDEAAEMMQAAGVRRLPVIDRDGNLVGIVSLGDIAVKGSEELASEALESISRPAAPDRSGTSRASGAAGGGSASGRASR